jgi:hypothetical protein
MREVPALGSATKAADVALTVGAMTDDLRHGEEVMMTRHGIIRGRAVCFPPARIRFGQFPRQRLERRRHEC